MPELNLEPGAKSVTLPAGTYIIGDPCYHVPEEQWDRVLEESGFFAMGGPGTGPNDQCHATFEAWNGRTGTVVAFSTAVGDGLYEDSQGREYGVDAGLIGIIPAGDVDSADFDGALAKLVTFSHPVECYEKNGVIVFGHVAIDTNDEEVDDYGDDE
jgi:hypothetical protein